MTINNYFSNVNSNLRKLKKMQFEQVSKDQVHVLNMLLQNISEVAERKVYLEGLGNFYDCLKSDASYFIDERDYNIYSILEVGGQQWLGENLRYEVKKSAVNPSNPSIEYGRLYTWDGMFEACPSGWHLPSDKEWNDLEEAFGVAQKEVGRSAWRGKHGLEMKSTSGWPLGHDGTNSFGFNVYPAGAVYRLDTFSKLGQDAYFWSSTTGLWPSMDDPHGYAWCRRLHSTADGVYRDIRDKSHGHSCRCIKDVKVVYDRINE